MAAPLTSPAHLAAARAANAEGVAAMRGGDAGAAVTAFRRAVAADPDAQPLWFNLAHACRLAEDEAGERVALERSLAIDRGDFGSQLRMAQLLQRQGDAVAALAAWNGVLALAASGGNPSAEVAAELTAGAVWCAGAQQRVEAAVAQEFEPVREGWSAGETRRIDAFVARALGKRQVYHNECAGLYFPFLPEDEFFDAELFPWFAAAESAAPAIAAELAALLATPGEALRPYVQMEAGLPENKWSALDHSLDWGACHLWEYGVANGPVIERCPVTAALLDTLPLCRIPGRAPNAFFSQLAAGAHIPPHTGVTNTRAIVHLALDVPEACRFRVGNETREWIAGRAFAFDDTIEHEAWNRSDRPRAVLIFDTWNPHLRRAERDAVVRYGAIVDAALAQGPV